MRKMIILLALAVIFLYGCQDVVCNAPYIQVGSECCLDSDSNKVCDKDEEFEEESEIIIIGKEPQIVEKEVIKYICADGSVVMDKAECPIEESEPVEEEVVTPKLIITNEENTVIQSVTLDPACVQGDNGGEIYFKLGTVSGPIKFQVKEAGREYEDVYTRKGTYESYTYFKVCDGCRGGDFKLKPDKLYVFRIMFDQNGVYGRFEYSNEHLIDTTEDSVYLTKRCSG